MSRPPRARQSVLDAFETILIDAGERAATLEATARAAGVSKGGLLYHFASKDALAAGVIERLRALVDADVAAIGSAPEGPIAYFLRSSALENDPLDRALIAVSRLAQGGHTPASAALREVRAEWGEAMRPHAKDAASFDLIMLISDGLYYNNALKGDGIAGPIPRGAAMDDLIALVERAAHG
ncbi:TetR/AcrR family transcriptional regulator [Microbacterium sp. zg.B48]|uniref:TetR/AcrR family transcriptional regulator n=1 Tax=Microbacterium sp. zg.B48 TaxID=2969408 RepID=UPI00214B43D9|nr:TetR/AcrR family transcriptional regulator [Microbacterium sp. zg.B48]MCR2763595.1 TetR/AcrR family transcriptional regulator [Microbacterium sp. zg.B48]